MSTEVATFLLPLHRVRPIPGDTLLAEADADAEGEEAQIRIDTRGLFVLIPRTGESYGVDLRALAGAAVNAIVKLRSKGDQR